MISWFFRWYWHRRLTGLAHLRVVLYTRAGCHLCEAAWNFLDAEQRQYRFALESVDVDSEPELANRYGVEVPVVSVNGKIRFRGGVNPVLWKRLLRGEAARAVANKQSAV